LRHEQSAQSLVAAAVCCCHLQPWRKRLDASQQLIVVTSKNWDDIQGTAQRYERHGDSFEKFEARFAWCWGKTAWAGARA
jgi:hypothetical protein